MTRGEMRLRVVRSLPRTHEDYIVKAIRKRCEQYLATQSFGITVAELVSQVWFKLMAGASVGTDEEHLPNLLDRNSWSETDPTGDVRVRWLLNELNDICSSLALRNLCVDLIRERQGKGGKRPLIPIDGTELENEKAMQHEPIQGARLQVCDLRLAWKGLLDWRQSECNSADDDVLAVLTVFAEHPEIESGFSSQWPIKEIVRLLNARDGQPVWTQRNVDNAKEKLERWITKKKQGFDDYEDFEALLVRIGRKLDDKERSADGAWPDGRQIRSGGRQ